MHTTTSTSPRFLHLRVKLASLVAEARIIRREEHRALARKRAVRRARAPRDLHAEIPAWATESAEQQHAESYLSLRAHRRSVVGGEARLTHLALTALRGRTPYAKAEAKTSDAPDLGRLRKLLDRYMLPDDRSRIDAWLAAADQHLVDQGLPSQRAPSAQPSTVSHAVPSQTTHS